MERAILEVLRRTSCYGDHGGMFHARDGVFFVYLKEIQKNRANTNAGISRFVLLIRFSFIAFLEVELLEASSF